MLQLTYPGVYTQEVSSGVRAITGAATSVALFIGPTRSGIDGRPTRVRNFGDFERSFGGLSQSSSLSYSVLHFFANGGGEAVVQRVPANGAEGAVSAFKSAAAGAAQSMTFTALSSGSASNDIFIEFDRDDLGADVNQFNLTITDRVTGRVERFGGLTTVADNARYAETVVNATASGSQLVNVTVEGKNIAAPAPNGTVLKVAQIAAGKFAKEVRVAVTIRVRASDGTVTDAVAKQNVIVYAANDETPTAGRFLAAKLERAINRVLANAPTATGYPHFAVEAQLFDLGKHIRLRASPAMIAGDSLANRSSDATVIIEDADPDAAAATPASARWTNKLTDLQLTPESAMPSRYRLGQLYATVPAGGNAATSDGADVATVTAGADSSSGQPDTTKFGDAIESLADKDPFFNVLCLPDLVRPSATDPKALFHSGVTSLYDRAASICRKKHAFLLVDPFPNVVDVPTAEAFKSNDLAFAYGTHAAAFFPNIRVDDPLEPGAIRSHPPSGAIAGVLARTDGQVGVWQAPAGTEATLVGVYGPSIVLSDDDQGVLNVLGLNCIRQFPIYGTVNFGSRTVDGANAKASEWKYIPVRRTANHILRSLSESLRWAVHKPNGEQLWAELRLNVTAFMHGLFRQGAFKGTSAREAYFVRCDASTTTAAEIALGIVNIQVGYAPLNPAEFVVITLRQIVQAQN